MSEAEQTHAEKTALWHAQRRREQAALHFNRLVSVFPDGSRIAVVALISGEAAPLVWSTEGAAAAAEIARRIEGRP